ncbi:MAG: ABC transporter substrate-binding protein [Actinomycetota bacterium]|nr:ABC transporter substrate-binding protein [Actinomycetota bacterium]
MLRRPLSLVAILLAFVLTAAACGAGSDDDDSSADDTEPSEQSDDTATDDTATDDTAADDEGDAASGEVVIGLTAEPANLDFTTTDGAAIPQALLDNVYEGLVALDPSGEIVPRLATDWEVSDDRLTYTFTLAEGVTFSDGAELTAEDVKFSIERVQTDWEIAIAAGMEIVESVEVVSPTEVSVTLAEPSNSWLFAMTSRIGAIFSQTGVDDLANTAIGTGPYEVAEWNPGDSLVLAARDDYWGEAPDIETVTLRYFEDATALNNALLSEGIDVIAGVQATESLDQFTDDDRFQLIEGTTNGELVLSLNNGRAPFDDPLVRQAVISAIDRQALLDVVYSGLGVPIGSMVPPTDPWYEDLTGVWPYDPARAEELLAEAGVEDLSLTFDVPQLPYAVNASQVIQSQLGEVGIDVELETLEFPAVWLEQVFSGHDYDMSIIAHVEPRDIGTFGNPDYYWGYDNAEVQALLAAADTAPEDEYVAQMQQVASTLAEDVAAGFLFVLPNLIVAETDIEGLPENAVGEALQLRELSRS